MQHYAKIHKAKPASEPYPGANMTGKEAAEYIVDYLKRMMQICYEEGEDMTASCICGIAAAIDTEAQLGFFGK